MKNKLYIIAFSIFLVVGCSDFLDVNDNPNYPKEVEGFLLLPSAQASIANVMSADYGLLGSFWSQHWAQNNTSSQYKSYETYTFSKTTGVVDRSYRELFIGGLADNEIMLKEGKETENWGLYLMAASLKAYTFQYLVDLYGNVPYSEAFLGENERLYSPEIEDGEVVYNKIYNLLDTALAKDVSEFIPEYYINYDLFFAANLDEWKKFANSIKLRILLRQYEVNTVWVESELNKMFKVDSVEFLTRDVQLTNFDSADSKNNPLYESDQLQLNTSNNIRANATFTSYLKANNDPRIEALFSRVGGELYGMITGSYVAPSSLFSAPTTVAKPRITWNMPVNLMTVAETELLLAEAYLRLGDATQAQSHYEAGVTSSFARIGASIGSLLSAEYAFPGTTDEQLKAIIMQKWVDAAEGQRGIESFIEWVRTGYPEVSEVSDDIPIGHEGLFDLSTYGYVPGTLIYSKKGATGGVFPVRLPYANSEVAYNANGSAFSNLIDLDVMKTNVWWKQ